MVKNYLSYHSVISVKLYMVEVELTCFPLCSVVYTVPDAGILNVRSTLISSVLFWSYPYIQMLCT